ncbi:MAG: hypothetical protein ACP5QA_16080 [Phycisphaerae bacterium]
MPTKKHTIEFDVDGLPPKKDGAKSMWGKDEQIKRLLALRKQAVAVMPEDKVFCSDISLCIKIFVAKESLHERHCGDLDNFITGICDGLMAATPKAVRYHRIKWQEHVGKATHLTETIAIDDDSKVTSISATKNAKENNEKDHYHIVICGHLKDKDSDAH